jgi:hypothetical protein
MPNGPHDLLIFDKRKESEGFPAIRRMIGAGWIPGRAPAAELENRLH